MDNYNVILIQHNGMDPIKFMFNCFQVLYSTCLT